MQTRLQMVTEIREGLEIVQTSEYLNFLKCYYGPFSSLLTELTTPQLSDTTERKLRNLTVEILNRLPHTEVLRPFVQSLLKLSIQVLTSDNEENGIMCMQIFLDLLRNFRPNVENELQPFLDFVCEIYQNFGANASYMFEERAGGPEKMQVEAHISAGWFNPSTRSFKIVTETVFIVLFLFQLYGQPVQTSIPRLLPLMVAAISVRGPEKVHPHLKNRFIEMKAAQAKTVSFLTYMLRSFADYIRPHEESICKSIVNLLVSCPEFVGIRKEFLIALKHILATDFKKGLFPLIDSLMDERVLVGTGRACFELLRPLAYNILAEIVYHVRRDLILSQLSQIIYLFSRNMHDTSLPLAIHTTSARLMLNLVEPIFERGVDQPALGESRVLLERILDAFAGKFGTLKHTIPQLVLNLQVPLECAKEVNDHKHLIKTLVTGMKTLIWSISHAHLPQIQISPSHAAHSHLQASQSSDVPFPLVFEGLKEDEVRKTSGFLKSGVYCLALFKEKEEEREMLHLFSQILVVMEPRNLMDMFSMCMPELFECMISNTQLLHIFSTLLQSPKVLRPSADILANFLVSGKMDVLKHPDTPAARLVIQLFRFLFAASTKAPSDCERILQPHVVVIMDVCMKNATEVNNPLAYMQLLRTMFQSVSEGKFELLLRDLIPTLHPCLNMLLSIVEGPTNEDVKDLVLELCLTLPARLSSLLPHLPHLMKPLVLALKGSDDLVGLGLRTLEYWIDSLNPDFLEPTMGTVVSDVIVALWSHLRPSPYPWRRKALQLLGKLGGRNRRFLKEPLELDCKENPEHGFRLILMFEPSTPFVVPLDRCIYLAVSAVMRNKGGIDAFSRKQALKFLRVCLSSQLNLRGYGTGEAVSPGLLATSLIPSGDPLQRRIKPSDMELDTGVKTKAQLMAERSVLKMLLVAIIAASAEPDLDDPNDNFVVNICHHFAMIFHLDFSSAHSSIATGQHVGSMLISSSNTNSRLRTTLYSNLRELDPLTFLDALVDVLADENRLHAKAALNALYIFSDTLLLLASSVHTGELSRGCPGSPMIVFSPSKNHVYSPPSGVQIPVFEQLLLRLLHCCYGSTWQAQIGGVMGLGALVSKVAIETLCFFQVRIVRGLVFVLKRIPAHAHQHHEETSQVLMQVLRVVNSGDGANNVSRRQSFQGVVDFLATELFSSNVSVVVRKNVQSCLALLASWTGSEVSELLEPLCPPLLQPLLMQSLRSRSIEQQVGTVISLNFCLALRPPLLRLTAELVNILQEAVQIAEADETVWVVKFMNSKVATELNKLRTACIEFLVTAMASTDMRMSNHSELRAKIIGIFIKSLTSRTPEIVIVAKEGLRQVIQRQKLPKDLLQSCLRPILVNLSQTKNLSIPLLQGLGHLLELMSNWFNVTIGSKLLEHLKKWLEPEKLAQCQKSWKAGEEPKIAAAIIELFHLLPPAAGRFLDDLVTLTIDLEGALPQGKFYSGINSPFRLPLTKFLNRHATDSVDYFLARLGQPRHFWRFMCIICSDAGLPLRDELARSPQKILSHAFPQFYSCVEGPIILPPSKAEEDLVNSQPESFSSPPADPIASSDAYFQGLALISALVKLMPNWLVSNRVVFDTLLLLWKSPTRIARLQNEQDLNLVEVKESKWLVKCFLNYIQNDKSEIGVLFDMLSIFLIRTRIDYTFLKDFYIIEVSEGYAPNMKTELIQHFLHLFEYRQLGHDHLVVAMQMLILPMLAHTFQNGQSLEVVGPVTLKKIVDKLLDPPEEVSAEYDEPLRIELLKLATLLLKYRQDDLAHHRRELIKFGWSHLKREDSISKQWAFVNVCHFLKAFEAPEKIILQVYGALLRTCQLENKMLVDQALDILMPALPRRLPHGDPRMPVWICYTKRILVEEGHSVPNLIHIFQLIVRHQDLFYSWRALFVPQLVNSLNRLGLPYNTTSENRHLAMEIAGLVVAWERRRQNEMRILLDTTDHGQTGDLYNMSSVAEASMHPSDRGQFPDDLSKQVKVEPGLQFLCVVSPGGESISNMETPGAGQPDEGYKTNAAMEEMIINFLIRVSLAVEPKDKETRSVYKQALELLLQALEVWPNANVKFNYVEKLLGNLQLSQSKDPTVALAQCLDVINTGLEKQPHMFMQNNISQISKILDPCFSNKILNSGKSLCSLLKMVFVSFPLEATNTPHDVKLLYERVGDLIQKHLVAVTTSQISPESSSVNAKLGFVLSVIKTLTEVQKNFIDSFITLLARVLQCLTREMGSSSGSHKRKGERMDLDSAISSSHAFANISSINSNWITVLKLIGKRVMLFPECKRSITQLLYALLSEKCTDASVLLCILDVITIWLEDDFRPDAYCALLDDVLSQKEIISHLQKLSLVNKQNFSPDILREWDGKYLQLLYGICANSSKYPPPMQQEVFQMVERKFMLGLRAKNPEHRQQFFSLYHEWLGKALFTRLQYIIQIQDWEALSDVFWLKQGLDLLLAILIENEPITLAPNSAQLPPLMISGSLPVHSSMQEQLSDTLKDCERGSFTFENLVCQHAQFLNEMNKLQVADLVIHLRELSHADSNVAYHMWVLVFPIVWAMLRKEEQLALVKPMISLLSKDYHKKQQANRPNVMQALLEGLYLSQPQLRMPSELIKYIGRTYNAWHISLAVLESHVMMFMNDTNCSESLVELYRLLNEEDMRCGLLKKRSITDETKAGLSFIQHGYWKHAQGIFYQAMVKATQGIYNNTVPKAEMCLWEEQWLYCACQLSQWDVLVDFGKSVENYEILLNSLWKVPDWAYMKDKVIPRAQVEETPNLCLVQAFFSLHNRKNTNGVEDAENIVRKGVELALEQWWQLPELFLQSQTPLLQLSQQLVEVQESARIITAISNGCKQLSGSSIMGGHGGYMDLKDILETWRLRTPNDWDNYSVWYDLLQWRNEIYNIVIDAFKDFTSTNPQLHNFAFRDKAWNVNKLAHIARKQGLHDVCITILEKMYGHSSIEVQEAFVKIREQAKAYLEMKGELMSGLNLINCTNLEFFPGKHKAEMFRLKGDFLLKLNDSENANLAYSNAISLFKHLPKGWISWGNYCDLVYKETCEEIWLEYAVSCFLQGIKYGVSSSRSHLARILYLISFDTPNEPVGRAFDKYLDQIPHWIWLSWIPQLLMSLQRSEAPHCKLVLLKIATVYPQALYYWLRTYYMEKRNAFSKSEFGRNVAIAQQQSMQQTVSGPTTGSFSFANRTARTPNHIGGIITSDVQVRQTPQSSGVGSSHNSGNFHGHGLERPTAEGNINDGPDQLLQHLSTASESSHTVLRHGNGSFGWVPSMACAFDAAKDIMDFIRSKHSTLISELEVLLLEIGSKFTTSPEERLLTVVNALLHRCYKCPTATTAEVPQPLKKELSDVCTACFSEEAMSKHPEILKEYKQDFERDLDPESMDTFPRTLSELTERLKRWKIFIQGNIEDKFPPVLKLEEENKTLCDFHVGDVEIPGQYFTDKELAPDHTVKLDRFGADVPIVRRHGSSFRRLTLMGSDGSQRHFIVQTSITPNARSDERVLQLFRVMNRMFERHKESRRRHLCIHTPVIIPVWSQARLVEDDLMYSTFLEVYEFNCARSNLEVDKPITYFKNQLNQAILGQISPEAVMHLRLQAYCDITKSIVKDNIFSQYMYKILPSGNHLWAFKKQFSIQLSISSFLSYLLQVGGRTPNKFLFAKSTGKIFQTDFHPAYDANGMIEFNEPVPFRLTRNMQAFFSQIWVEGLITSSMCAAAQSVASPKQSQHIWYHLAMFFRDDLLSWSCRRPLQGMHSIQYPAGNINPLHLQHKVTSNVENVVARIRGIAPQYLYKEDENASTEPPESIQRGVAELVEAAMAPRNLCMMEVTWHPWF